MVHLLKIVVSGYKMLSENFTIDFTTKAKVSDDLESEIYIVYQNLYAFNIMAYTGSNASGKTTVYAKVGTSRTSDMYDSAIGGVAGSNWGGTITNINVVSSSLRLADNFCLYTSYLPII